MKNQDTKITALKLNNFIISNKIKTILIGFNFKIIYSFYINDNYNFNSEGEMDWLLLNRCLFISLNDFLAPDYKPLKFRIPAFRYRRNEFKDFIKKYPLKIKNKLNNLDYLLIPVLYDETLAQKYDYEESFDKFTFKLLNSSDFKYFKTNPFFKWKMCSENYEVIDHLPINMFLNKKDILRFKRKIKKI
jgi:hypothetical protein